MGVFSSLQSCDIGTIWLVACEVAAQQGVATGGAGKTFCAELAKTAGCNVIASAATQYRQYRLLLARGAVGLHRRLRGSDLSLQAGGRASLLRLVTRHEMARPRSSFGTIHS